MAGGREEGIDMFSPSLLQYRPYVSKINAVIEIGRVHCEEKGSGT